ncbi:MAG TPA: hypothetical protein PK514_12715 [Spirochaetota bacterium]|nr:hypothetical protein [Spirochaetota bacterium]
METTYYSLGSKATFNKALRHFYAVNDAVSEIESTNNIADYLNNLLDEEELNRDQILPLIGAVLKDKFNYSYHSFSAKNTITDFEKIANETCKWSALDLVIIYYAPDGARFAINPKDADSWERAREIHKDQLIVVYAKFIKEKNSKLETESMKTLQALVGGKDVFINKEFIDKTIVPKKAPAKAKPQPQQKTQQQHHAGFQMQPETEGPAARFAATPATAPTLAESASVQIQGRAPQAGGSKKTITPKYGVQVSNELFHNGNVEAWKKILESYQVKYPDLTVHIMYEGEVINDINSLFKWGKVKHGDSIFFQVSGEEIIGVSKLQKYLYEGASQRYTQFLKLGIGRVLNLF